MYAKKFRLPIKRGRIKSQKTFSSPYFLLKTSDNGKSYNRFGIIISTGAVRGSTRRHFWKRNIADCLKELPNLNKDFLVIVSPKIEKVSQQTVLVDMDKFFKKIESNI